MLYLQKQYWMENRRFERMSHSQKWGDCTRDEDSFMMTLADMDLPLWQPLKRAIVSRLKDTNNFTYKNISQDCYEAIISWYQQRHVKSSSTSILKEQIVDSPSLLNILYLLIDKMTTPNDGILLLTPIYNYYDRIVRYLKRRVVESKLYSEVVGNQVRYEINFSDLQEKAKQCKIMVFCNPHNPSGRIWTQKEVEKIVAICQKNNILIVSDEILSDLVPLKHSQKFYSLVNPSYTRIVVCNSISKAFNVQSLRAGYAIIKDASIRNQMKQLMSNLNLYLNQFAMICTQIFYGKQGLKWLDYSLSLIHKNYKYLKQRIKGTLLVISELEAAYIITVNLEGYLKYIERWFRKKGEGERKNMVSSFLNTLEIKGIEMIYANQNGIFTDIRMTIAIQNERFIRFADRLRAGVLQLEYQYRQIDPKL